MGNGDRGLAKKKKKAKKHLKRWKKQKIQQIIDAARDDDDFLDAVTRYYPDPASSPYGERFHQAASRRIRFFLARGAIDHAVRYTDYLDPRWPDALLARGAFEIVSGDEKRGLDLLRESLHQAGLVEQAPRGDYDPEFVYEAANRLLRYHEYVREDHRKLRDAVTISLDSEKLPRPRFHCTSAVLLWKLIRLLIRAEKEGPDLPPAYWYQLQQCVKELEENNMEPDCHHNLLFLLELNRAVKARGANVDRALSRVEELATGLMLQTNSMALYGIHPALGPLENILKARVTSWLRMPEVAEVARSDYPELSMRLIGHDTDVEDLWRHQNLLELLRDRDIEGLSNYIDREFPGLSPRERLLVRLALLHLMEWDDIDPEGSDAHDPFPQETFGDYADMRQDVLLDLARETCSLAQQVEPVEMKVPVLKDLKELLLKRSIFNEYMGEFGETCLELAENLQGDEECLLNAYLALGLAGTRKALLRRVKKELEARVGRLRQDDVVETLSNLLGSTVIETEHQRLAAAKKLLKSWRNLLEELQGMGIPHWPEIEQRLVNDVLKSVQIARFMYHELFIQSPGLGHMLSRMDPEEIDILDPSLKLTLLEEIFPEREEIKLARRFYGLQDKKQGGQEAEIERLFKGTPLPGKIFILHELGLKHDRWGSRDTWMPLARLLSDLLLCLPRSPHPLDTGLIQDMLFICNQVLESAPRGKGIPKMKNELKRIARYTLKEILDSGPEPHISGEGRAMIQNFLKRLR